MDYFSLTDLGTGFQQLTQLTNHILAFFPTTIFVKVN